MIYHGIETQKVLQYLKEKYDGEPEFLWTKTPKNAVFRHKDNLKWYAALLNISKRKLGLVENDNNDDNVDILDLKCDPILVGSLRDGKNYFPAYHMNKEYWITILLDHSIRLDDVFALIDFSYNITKK